MSDEFRDAMRGAVDRIAPFPPNAEALKAAAKRSRFRRNIIGGWIGFIILGALSGWLFFDNDAGEGRPRPDRNQVAAPATWDNPGVSNTMQFPGYVADIAAVGTDLWVGLHTGTLLRIDTQTRETIDSIDVGSGINDIAADEQSVWIGGTRDGDAGPMPVPYVSGSFADTIFRLEVDSGEVAVVSSTKGNTHPRMAAGNGNLFFLRNAFGQEYGEVTLLSPDGEFRSLGFSALSLTAADGSVWAAAHYEEAVEMDADTGEILQRVDITPNSGDSMSGCLDCAPPPGTIAANESFVAQLSVDSDRLVVLDRSSGQLLNPVDGLDQSDSITIDGSFAFLGQPHNRLAVVDLRRGEVVRVIDGLGLAAGPMTVSPGSVWVAGSYGQKIVEVSDLGPAPDSAIGSAPPEDDLGPGYGRCCLETYRDEELGFSVTYPDDEWHRAAEPMTKLVNPREIVTIGTVPLEINDDQLGDCAPVEPLSRVGPWDVLIFVLERQFSNEEPDSDDYPPRPNNLGVDDLRGPETLDCWGDEIRWTTFKDSGRAILVYVALGENVTPDWYDAPSEVLDSLRFEPLDEPSQ